ncbi:unnamed protein product [Ectocarpus sp. 4 AP-2014]
MSETTAGKWFNLGGGGAASQPASSQSSRFPSMPNVNIPGFRREQEPTLANEMCEICPSLTFQQRVGGFVVCLALGYLLSFLSTVMLWSGDLSSFALIYCLGSLIAIGATSFLIGPRRQCGKMFHKKRRIACVIYLVLLFAVIILAFLGTPAGIILLILIVQMCAAVWYTASYIPYGRAMIKGTLCPCLKDLENQDG